MKILITGASSGIGEACAQLLVNHATHLVLTARRWERLEKLKQEFSRSYPKVKIECISLDVRDRQAVDAFAPQIQDIDVVINNAGLARGNAPLQSGDVQDWEDMIDTNVKGLLYITRAILPGMIQRKIGHVVNIGSVAGRWVYPGGNVYNATKFAVRALSEGLRQDVNGSGIRVTNIEPGMVETEFSEVRFQDKDKAKKVYEGMTPLTALDIAETVLWCLLRPAHVNIQEVVIFPTDQASIQMIHRK